MVVKEILNRTKQYSKIFRTNVINLKHFISEYYLKKTIDPCCIYAARIKSSSVVDNFINAKYKLTGAEILCTHTLSV